MDPRIQRSRRAVLEAATQLLVEGGPAAVTVDGVVERSGVAKSTIYRHWESRDELLTAVFETHAPQLEPPAPHLAFHEALDDVVRQLVATLTDPAWAEMLPALLLLKLHEDGPAEVERRLEGQQATVLREVLDRGVAEGAIRPGYPLQEAIVHLAGPLVFARITGLVELGPSFVRRTRDQFLSAYGPA